MNIADNSFRAAWIKPIRPYSHDEQMNPDRAVRRMPFPKEFPETNEAFVFTIPETGLDTSTDYGCFTFLPPSSHPVDENTVLLWGQEVGKRFTGCDPAATGDNLGFEYIATPSFVYYRNPDGTIGTPDPVDPGLVAALAAMPQTRAEYTNLPRIEGSINGSGQAELELYFQYDTESHTSFNNTVRPQVTGTVLGISLIWGMGTPPAVPPGTGLHVNNCFRPRIIAVSNDL